MAGEEEAWRPHRLWRWNVQPATSLDDVPPSIGWLGYIAALTITGGPAFCYLAYQLGQRDGVRLQSTEEPYSRFRWRLVPWAVLAVALYLMPLLGFKGLNMPVLLVALAGPLVASLVVAHVANLCYKQGLRVGAKTQVAPETIVTSGVWAWALTGVFFFGTLFVYYFTAFHYEGASVPLVDSFLEGPSPAPHNHPVRLADSFLHGRLDVADGKDLLGFLDFACHPWAEPVPQGGIPCAEAAKYYPLEPPGTALVILPGVALFGLNINQTLVSIVIGAITAAVVYQVSRRLTENVGEQVWLTAMVVFGTVYWWNAVYGGVWYFNHAVAALFLFAAVYETLAGKRPFTAGVFLGAAYITRLPTVWCFPFFVIMFTDWGKVEQAVRGLRRALSSNWWGELRSAVRRILDTSPPLLKFGAGLGIFVVGFAILNIIRFDTPSPDATLANWHARPQLSAPGQMLEHGLVSAKHIDRHRPIFFEKPFYITDEKPYIYPSWNGAAFWATTPAFLLAFLAAIRKRWLRWAGAAAMVLTIGLLVIVPRLGGSSTQQGWLDRPPRGEIATAIDGFLDFLRWDSWARWPTQWPTSEVVFGLPVSSWLVLLPYLALIAISVVFAIRSRNKLVVACWSAVIPVVGVHFLAGSTGWPQFGYRYLLDYVPFVFLLTWEGMGRRLTWYGIALIAAGIAINACGVLWTNKFDTNQLGGIPWTGW